jgi:hypothetical protein
MNTKSNLFAKASSASLIIILLLCGGASYSRARGNNLSNFRKSAKRMRAGRPLRAKLQIPKAFTEEFTFLIKDLKVQHQSEYNNLNIMIRYRYTAGIANTDYPDFRLISGDIKTFLMRYPNEEDYWEIVNKN